MKSLLCVWSIITFVSQYHSKIIRNLGEEHSVLAAKELNILIHHIKLYGKVIKYLTKFAVHTYVWMSLHSSIIVGRYQESGQDRSVLANAWENEIKVQLNLYKLKEKMPGKNTLKRSYAKFWACK